MVEMPCNSENVTSYHCACARDLHGNVMYVIWTLNSVYLRLFVGMPAPAPPPSPLDPRFPLVNEMSPHIYTTHVSGILGVGGNRVVDAEDNIQLKNLTSGGNYSVSKYTEASSVQIYKMVSCMRGWTTIYPALSVFYACIVLKIAHTVDNQNL